VHSAAAEIEAAGGRALPIVGDVRNDDDITAAVLKTQGEFGGIDIVVNNASVIDLSARSSSPRRSTTSCRTSTSAARSCSAVRPCRS
jgi:NAD(P)-dependent dehydrogenase (short-subunit alcohol dehydrogenase family)